MGDDIDRMLPRETGSHSVDFDRWWFWGARIFRWTWMGIAGLLCLALVTVLYLKSRPLPPPEIPMTTKILDIHGRPIDQLDSGEHREPIRLGKLPPHLIQATLAAEDQRFFQHWGFSAKGIARAIWVNLREGRLAQGASTITQQLARNLYLTHDRTWSRKVREAMLTAQLELHYSKKEILEMYLNKIYYGHGAYGIGRAARLYFGKDAKDLTLAESAMLAGIPRGPRWFSPLEYPDRAKSRQKMILDAMARQGKISRQEAAAAKSQTLTYAPPPKPAPARAPYFRDYVLKAAVQQWGLDEHEVRNGGLKITTTLDLSIQQKAEQAVQRYLSNQGDLQAALVSVEPATGYIKAMVGGKDYRQSPYNRVFGKRQPGSTFKPILYLAALQDGLTPLTRFESRPTVFPYEGGTYEPSNYHDRYAYRPITMQEAIATSDNVYAVSTHLLIGRNQAIQMARLLGIVSPLQPVPSLALGSSAVSPYEMVQAYAAIADNGRHRTPVAILRIEDARGEPIDPPQAAPVQQTSAPASFVLTKMMETVFQPGGTANRVGQMLPYRSIAGKTGSTHWDSWLSGFTPNLATTVWLGYDKGKPLPDGASRLTHNIWGSYMRDALRGKPNPPFQPPSGVVKVQVDPATGYLATSRCPRAREMFFIAGTEPRQTCPNHPFTTPSPPSPSLLERLKKWWFGS
ncbi:penicillin-binding protein 2D [Marinithermofilum abyssi]|uniref:Penicillin-binding protein 2D n=1 Tax=Marinithermofilum abyssi TaxID=1571185 RepID=A0A8J2VBJ0_9BACL|nr:transglycosylase domain-containing protein [Marinithermofilum abyssi]GGE05729.1 penicillin-binding protein 2D [Marinithermofilum abyssi]